MDEVDEFLQHFGVKGMRWGVRHKPLDRVSRVADGTASRKTLKDARKDAEEYARAKLFYGTGAGTRRKLIKNTVEAKKKKDPAYAKAFDQFLAEQDLSQHASKAQKERHRIDRKLKTKQRAGFLARTFTGEMGTQAAFTAAILAGGTFLASPKGRRLLQNGAHKVSSLASDAKTEAVRRKGAAHINRLLKNMT